MDDKAARDRGNGSFFKDPAFADNKSLPVHRWVPWIAGFSASFVDGVLDTYLGTLQERKRVLVLDPFSGVGTTLLQSALRGHDYVGFEINPYAVLAARVKLKAVSIDTSVLDGAIHELKQCSSGWKASSPCSSVKPAGFKSRIPFFSPRVERQVLHTFDFISRLPQPEVADLFRVAFGSVMVSFSNYTYEPSLGSRPGAGKPLIEDANVGEVLLAKLRQMRADIQWIKAATDGGMSFGHGEVRQGDFFTGHAGLAEGSIDLMVTSPPYLNNYHYVRNTRPQMYWLSLMTSTAEQRQLEENNFGKFWQTVRDEACLSLDFEHPDLARLLDRLRRIRVEAGAYGGNGWANYAAAYFNDCSRFMAALRRILARGGVGVVVIGNSIIQGLEIRTDEILGDIGIQHGLLLEGIHRNRAKRVGASITQSAVRRGETNRSILYESTGVLRKP